MFGDKKKKDDKKREAAAKQKLAGEVYDLLTKKYDPSKVKGLPRSKQSFIRQQVNRSLKELKQNKKELQDELGISKSTPKPTPKKEAKKVPARKSAVSQKAAIGYTAKIKLPDGRTLIASETGLRDIKTLPSRIVLSSKEQALQAAKNLAVAYGKGAKPVVGTSKK